LPKYKQQELLMHRQSFIGGITVLSNYGKQASASFKFATMAALVALVPAAAVAMVIEDQVLCYSDRPCIESVVSDTRLIQLSWRAGDYYDFYNVRWSREGVDAVETHRMLQGGNRGSLALTKILPNTQYIIKVQGCNTQLIGGPACTAWEMQEVVTQNFEIEEPVEEAPMDEQPLDAAPAPAPGVSAPRPKPDAPSIVVPTTEVPASEIR
jgi:hypothetical protein